MIQSQEGNLIASYTPLNVTNQTTGEITYTDDQEADMDKYSFFMGYRLVNHTDGTTIESDS